MISQSTDSLAPEIGAAFFFSASRELQAHQLVWSLPTSSIFVREWILMDAMRW
jgi:hypothetical protein